MKSVLGPRGPPPKRRPADSRCLVRIFTVTLSSGRAESCVVPSGSGKNSCEAAWLEHEIMRKPVWRR